MPRVQREVLLPYSSAQMFALVNDVARYPEFLPGCAATEILAQDASTMRARVRVAKAAFAHSFVTHNRWVQDASIEMQLAEGPFRTLQGQWQFTPLGAGCKVSVVVDFEFASKLMALALNGVFNKVLATIVDAFQQRARVLYGP